MCPFSCQYHSVLFIVTLELTLKLNWVSPLNFLVYFSFVLSFPSLYKLENQFIDIYWATCWDFDLDCLGIHGSKWKDFPKFSSVSVQFSSVAQSCPTLCDPMNCSTPGLPVHHRLTEFTQTHAHRIGNAIQPSHPLSSPSPPAPNPSQHQGLLQWGNFLHEVAKVLQFQLQNQSFQWTPRSYLPQDGLVGSTCSLRDSQESSPTPQF